jgi:hypothetical protein
MMNRRNYLALMGAAAGAVVTGATLAQEQKNVDPGSTARSVATSG